MANVASVKVDGENSRIEAWRADYKKMRLMKWSFSTLEKAEAVRSGDWVAALAEIWERRIAHMKAHAGAETPYFQGLIDAHGDCLTDLRAERASATSELCSTGWLEEAKAALRHAENAKWDGSITPRDPAYLKLFDAVIALQEALQLGGASSNG